MDLDPWIHLEPWIRGSWTRIHGSMDPWIHGSGSMGSVNISTNRYDTRNSNPKGVPN